MEITPPSASVTKESLEFLRRVCPTLTKMTTAVAAKETTSSGMISSRSFLVRPKILELFIVFFFAMCSSGRYNKFGNIVKNSKLMIAYFL